MKKIVAFILLCAFVVAIPVLSTVSVSGEDEMAYVVLGDSIAAGYRIDGLGTDGVAGINDSAYAGLVAKKFGLKLYNFAWCGHTSVDLVNRINGKVRVNASGGRRPSDMGEYVTVADAIAAAELVTISIGGNDLLDLLNFDQLDLSTITAIISGNVSPQISQVYVDAETNLRKAITRISEINPDAIIMVQTLYNPYIYETFLGGYVKGSGINYLIDKLNDIIYGLCEEMGNFYVAETAKALNADPGSFYSLAGGEDFHPTIIGHRHIADVISELYTSLKFGSGTDNTTAQTTVATVEASTKQATVATTVATTEQTTVATTVATTVQTTAATTAATSVQTTAATTAATTEQTTAATTAATTEQTTVAMTEAMTEQTTVATTVATTVRTTAATAAATTEQTTAAASEATTKQATAATTAATTEQTTAATTAATSVQTTAAATQKNDLFTLPGCGSVMYSTAALVCAVALIGTIAFGKRKNK